MDFVLCGNDPRCYYLGKMLLHSDRRVFFWESRFSLPLAHALRSPLELSSPVRMVLPFGAEEALILRALETLPVGSRIFGGALTEEAELLLKKRGLRYENLLENHTFREKNALPTAEGALAVLIEQTPDCICESEFLLTGFGSVARALAHLLVSVGARVIICARKGGARKEAAKLGYTPLKLPLPKSKKKLLCRVAALVNTVPAKGIISTDLLSLLPAEIPLLDLASGSENIDRAAARLGEHPIFALPSLPGKVAPQSAARYLADAIQTEK